MTKAEIDRIAKKVWASGDIYIGPSTAQLQEFARLIAAAEREACASIDVAPLNIFASDGPGTAVKKYIAGIRARSRA